MTRRSPALYSADSRLPLPAPRCGSRRRGFTIVELLMVVVVISILVALLFPAISGAFARAREAQVIAEMSSIDKAIKDFKGRFGMDPPSFMVLYEDAADWAPDNPAGVVSDAQHRACRAVIRQIWPDFGFNVNVDFNGDGSIGGPVLLNGTECLVFFRGGMFSRGADTAGWADDAQVGFANPPNPFATTSANNRTGPFFTFSLDRLVDIDNDGMPEYVDPLPEQNMPYVYVSSYDGRGYQPYGLDGTAGTDDDEIVNVSGNLIINAIYYQDNGDLDPNVWGPALNLQTYQLLSPGADNTYGTGGEYNGESVGSSRPDERDNITNFKGGRLN